MFEPVNPGDWQQGKIFESDSEGSYSITPSLIQKRDINDNDPTHEQQFIITYPVELALARNPDCLHVIVSPTHIHIGRLKEAYVAESEPPYHPQDDDVILYVLDGELQIKAGRMIPERRYSLVDDRNTFWKMLHKVIESSALLPEEAKLYLAEQFLQTARKVKKYSRNPVGDLLFYLHESNNRGKGR